MKNKFIITCLAIFSLAINGLSYSYPKTIAVHPTEDVLVVGHQSGTIIILEKSSFKFLSMVKVCEEIKSMCFNKEGSQLWIFGQNFDKKTCAQSLDSKTWLKKQEILCYKATFSLVANKVCYTQSYSSPELKIIDMTSAESVGSLKTAFTKEGASVDFFEFSSDGSQIIMAQRVYGDDPCEILVFPSSGYVAKPTKSYISNEKVTTGFGTGVSNYNNEHILIGWSETVKLRADSAEVLSRNYDFCYSFCASADGSYFFIGGGGKATQYNFTTMKTVSMEMEKINGSIGNVIGIATLDGKNYYYVTEAYVVGVFNSDGFVLKQSLINMNVDVLLRDSYKPENAQKINDACKANKLKVVVPEIYDKENPVKLASGVSMNEASIIIDNMRNSGFYCLISLIQQ